MFGNILGFLGLGLAAVSAIGSFSAASDRSEALDKQADQRRRAQELEDKKNVVKANRERMSLVREARIKRAAAVSNATFQGAQGSVRGAFGSTLSQSNSGLQYINQMMSLTGEQNIFFNRSSQFALEARAAGERASIFKGVGGIGSTIFKQRDDIAGLFS
tara:strand:- start:6339 stop:6818 length:480 start_codon:yes stop_codon:yes gene_type:complete